MILSTCLALWALSADLTVGPVDVNARGYIQNDFRFVIGKPKANAQKGGQWVRNEASIFGRAEITAGDHVSGVVSLRPVLSLISQPGSPQTTTSTFQDLVDRNKIGPFWFEFDNAYLAVHDLAVEGLELRLGQQVVVWGTGDFFNPTNTLNPRDFWDPLQFGRPMGNQMAVLKYQTPLPLSFQLVYIPVFRPARLPPEAQAAFNTDVVPIADAADRRALRDLNDFQTSLEGLGFGKISNRVEPYPVLPQSDLNQGNVAGKVAWSLFDIDFSASYFYGRWDLPIATQVDPLVTINPGVSVDTITRVKLIYPRMHQIGFDFSTSLEFLGGLGLWGEAALVVPAPVNLTINHPSILVALRPNLPCTTAKTCVVVRDQPFVKVTVGFDYTLTKWLYLNAQYLYGFVDEYGADFLNHYVVVNTDVKPLGDDYFLRLAGVFNLNDGSFVAFPALIAKLYTAVELQAGALIFYGQANQKFGKPEVGNTQFFLRSRFSF